MEQRTFERDTCGRCGGTGHFSYCQRYGTTCFGCGGSGKKLTKRGRAAHDMFAESLKVPAGKLVPGDKIWYQGGEHLGPSRWFTVIEVGYGLGGGRWWSRETNEWMSYYDIVCDGFTSSTFGPTAMVRKAWSSTEKAALHAAAIEYQDTLTKQGKPRKRRVAK